MSFNESVLNDVEGVFLIPHDANSQGIGTAVVAFEQGAERLAIAALRGEYQVPIVDSFTSSGRGLSSLIHAHLTRSYITAIGPASR